jgi:hypothetical protein
MRETNVYNYLDTLAVGMPASYRTASHGSSYLDSESCVGVVQEHKQPVSKAAAKTQIIGANIPCLL